MQGLAQVGSDVIECFNAANTATSTVRFIKLELNVNDMQVSLMDVVDRGNREASIDMRSVIQYLEQDLPCVVVYNLRPSFQAWTCILWVPDDSPVRSKMAYAATLSQIKQALGSSSFPLGDFFISEHHELTWSDFISRFDTALSALTMSEAERDTKEEIQEADTLVHEHRVMPALGLKVDESTISALDSFIAQNNQAIKLDVVDEVLVSVPIAGLDDAFAPTDPCFVLYNWKYSNSGNTGKKTVLVYYCPDDSVPRKRMVYSTCIQNVVAACKAMGIVIDKRVEISEASEVNDEGLMEIFYPKIVEEEVFLKPRVPRGSRRPASKQSSKHTFKGLN